MAAQASAQQHNTERTLAIYNVPHWVDERRLKSCFNFFRKVQSVEIIKNEQTGKSEGYGFVEFVDHRCAEAVLQTFHNKLYIVGTKVLCCLGWASSAVSSPAPAVSSPALADTPAAEKVPFDINNVKNTTVYITNLDSRITKEMLELSFTQFGEFFFTKIEEAKWSGVVHFTTRKSAEEAVQKMQRKMIGKQAANLLIKNPLDLTSTEVLIVNLDSNTTEDEIRKHLLPFGEIHAIKVTKREAWATMHFISRASAEKALKKMDGEILGNQKISLSIDFRQSAKEDMPKAWSQQVDDGQASTCYGHGHGYETNVSDLNASQCSTFSGQIQQVDVPHELAGAIPEVEQRDEDITLQKSKRRKRKKSKKPKKGI